ncbi:recombinase family protein, partial [Escherichia coli]
MTGQRIGYIRVSTFDQNPERQLEGHCCKVSDEAAFCLIQRPYISKTLLT